MTFVKFNNRILDKKVYEEELRIIKNHIVLSINDLLRNYGFKKKNNSFENKELNLKVELKFSKLEKEFIL